MQPEKKLTNSYLIGTNRLTQLKLIKMKKVLTQIFSLVVLMALAINVNAQCPTYGAVSSSNEACAGVEYYFEIPNTACPSQVTWNVVGNSGSFGNEISWQITNLTTGLVVASYGTFGGGSTGGNSFDFGVTVGPDPVGTVGTSYNLEYHDTYGDGFSGGGQIQITDYLGNQITLVDGNFGTSGNIGFATPQEVSGVTATITTSAGVSVIPLTGCAPVFQPMTFANANFCSTTSENITYSLTCDDTGASLASGNHTVTVYPSVPTAATDVVTIVPDASGCAWVVTPQNDCIAANIGSVFTISPDPATTTYTSGQSGSETFTVTYNGISGGPDCCAVGGPAVPFSFVTPAPTTSAVGSDSPFGGTLNAAYLTTGPAGEGGVAVSGSFDVVVSGFDYPEPNRANTTDAGNVCQEVVTANTFWVTIYVDGTLIADEQVNADLGTITVPNPSAPNGTASVGGYNITVTFADVQAAGVTFDENSVIEAYVYPNSFSGPSQPCGGATVVSTYSPGGALANPGEWDAVTTEISTVDFVFTELVPGPADCTLDITQAYNCTAPACTPNAGTIAPE